MLDDVFRPLDAGTVSLSATTGSSRVRLPEVAGRRQYRIHNAGSVPVFVRFGGVSIAAATTDMPIPGGVVETFSLDALDGGPLYLAGITSSGSATLYATSGYGA